MIQPNADKYIYLIEIHKATGIEYYTDSGMPHHKDQYKTTKIKKDGRRFDSAISTIAVVSSLRQLGEIAEPVLFEPYEQATWQKQNTGISTAR